MALRTALILALVILGGTLISLGMEEIYRPLGVVGVGLTVLGMAWVYSVLTKPRSLR